MSYLFISHDLAVVQYMADEVMVMKDGEIVEIADSDELYADPSIPIRESCSPRCRAHCARAGTPR